MTARWRSSVVHESGKDSAGLNAQQTIHRSAPRHVGDTQPASSDSEPRARVAARTRRRAHASPRALTSESLVEDPGCEAQNATVVTALGAPNSDSW